jgi:hypothetical protein
MDRVDTMSEHVRTLVGSTGDGSLKTIPCHCPGCTKCTLAVNPCPGLPSHKAVLVAYREHVAAKAEFARCSEIIDQGEFGDVKIRLMRDFSGAVRASARIMRAWDVLEAALADLEAAVTSGVGHEN